MDARYDEDIQKAFDDVCDKARTLLKLKIPEVLHEKPEV